MSPTWHPYLKSMFSWRKHCPFPPLPTSPLTLEEKVTQVGTRIIKLSNFNKRVCFALQFHILICCLIFNLPLSLIGAKTETANLIFAYQGEKYEERFKTRHTLSCVRAFFKLPLQQTDLRNNPNDFKYNSWLIFYSHKRLYTLPTDLSLQKPCYVWEQWVNWIVALNFSWLSVVSFTAIGLRTSHYVLHLFW